MTQSWWWGRCNGWTSSHTNARTRLAATPESHDRGGVKAHRTSAATAEGRASCRPCAAFSLAAATAARRKAGITRPRMAPARRPLPRPCSPPPRRAQTAVCTDTTPTGSRCRRNSHRSPGRGPRLVDVLQEFGSTGFGDFDGVHGHDSNLTLNTLSMKAGTTADASCCRPSHRRRRAGPREWWQRARHDAMATLHHTKGLANYGRRENRPRRDV